MRILQMHNHHSGPGGAMEVLAQEAILLTDAGHSVEQYTLPAAEKMGLSPLRAGFKAVWNVQASRDLAAMIKAFQPDVVHVHTPFPLLSPAIFRTASGQNTPIITTLHSYRYSCIAATCHRDGHVCEDCIGKRLKYPGLIHRCYHDSVGASAALTLSLGLHRQINTFSQHVTRFLALTDFSRRLLIRDGIPSEKVTVKPNFVPDPGVVKPPRSAEPYVAFIGRFIDIKGIKTLLKAWPQVRSGALRLKIAGDGELRPMVEEQARNDPSIEVLGWLDEAAVTDLMAGAQCVCVPSEWYEGQPLVILRSLSVGTPVLVSSLENLSTEVLEDDAGAMFEVGDDVSLARALEQLMRNLARTPLRDRARASYERRYSPAVNLEMLEAIYREAAFIQHAGPTEEKV